MKLFEIASTPIQYEWAHTSSTDMMAQFTVNGKKYIVSFVLWDADEDLPERWDIEFALVHRDPDATYDSEHAGEIRFDSTNTGNQFAVFGAVQQICRDWYKNVKPTCVTMSASSPSRINIYSKLLKSFLPSWNIQAHKTVIIASDPNIKY